MIRYLPTMVMLLAAACSPSQPTGAPTVVVQIPTVGGAPTNAPQPTTASPAPTAASPEPAASPLPTQEPTATSPEPTASPKPSPAPSATPVYDIFAPGGMGSACDSNPNPRFTAHITDLSQIAYLTPAGTVQEGDLKPHGFLHNKPGVTEVPVYAPVDSYLIDFAYYVQDGYSIYTFKFQVSCEVAYYVDHLQAVVDKIGAIMPDSPAADSRGTPVSPPLFFQAGELIGVTGDTPLSQNWDFGVLNTTRWNPLPTDKSFDDSGNAEKYRYAVCPYEYYDESMRAQYDALLGDQGCGP